MLRYGLLVLAWIFLLVINVLLWVNQGSPNIVALGIFAALSLVPIVDWMKIGNWFEFGKKGSHVKDEVTEKQESIVSIGSLNLELASEEAARAFAETLVPKSKEDLSEENKQVIEFIYNADQAIASVLPPLQIMYSSTKVVLENRPPTPKELAKLIDVDTLSLIRELKVSAPKLFKMKESEKKFEELLLPVERLVNLRTAFDENEASMPSIEEAKELVRQVYYTSGFLSGMAAQALTVLFNLFSNSNHKRKTQI